MLCNHQSVAFKHSADPALGSESEAKRGKYGTEIFQPSQLPPQSNGYHGSQLTTRNLSPDIVPNDLDFLPFDNDFVIKDMNETQHNGWFSTAPWDPIGCNQAVIDGTAFSDAGGANIYPDLNIPSMIESPATPTTRPFVFELGLDKARPTDLLTVRII